MARFVDSEAALRVHMERKGAKNFELRTDLRVQEAISHAVLLEYLGVLIPFASWVQVVACHHALAGLPPSQKPRLGPEVEWLPSRDRRTILFPRLPGAEQGQVVQPMQLAQLVDQIYGAFERGDERRFHELCQSFLLAWHMVTVSLELAPVGASPRKDHFRHALAYSLALLFAELRLGPTTMALLMAVLERDPPILIRSGESEIEAIAHRAENFKKLWASHSRRARTVGERLVELAAPPARDNSRIPGPVRSLSTGRWLAYRPECIPAKASVGLQKRGDHCFHYARWREEGHAQTRYLGPAARQLPGISSG